MMFIVNAPYALWLAWAVIKPWLDARTVAKIRILKGADDYRGPLLDTIDAEELLAEYGGSRAPPAGAWGTD